MSSGRPQGRVTWGVSVEVQGFLVSRVNDPEPPRVELPIRGPTEDSLIINRFRLARTLLYANLKSISSGPSAHPQTNFTVLGQRLAEGSSWPLSSGSDLVPFKVCLGRHGRDGRGSTL